MNKVIENILDQIPIETIYKYLKNKENAPKKQNGGKSVGTSAAIRKAKNDALKEMVRKMAL